MSNHHLRNKELTLKAKGLLSQMLSLNLFKIYCLSAAVMGGGIKLSAVFQMELICNRFLSAFQFLFCNLP